LRADSAQERWEGYWDVSDESYYARCVRADGSDQWYRVADEHHEATVRGDARVLVLRRPGITRAGVARMAVVGRANGGTMLVGTWRRRARAANAERGGDR
jgi:hypothetical protein